MPKSTALCLNIMLRYSRQILLEAREQFLILINQSEGSLVSSEIRLWAEKYVCWVSKLHETFANIFVVPNNSRVFLFFFVICSCFFSLLFVVALAWKIKVKYSNYVMARVSRFMMLSTGSCSHNKQFSQRRWNLLAKFSFETFKYVTISSLKAHHYFLLPLSIPVIWFWKKSQQDPGRSSVADYIAFLKPLITKPLLYYLLLRSLHTGFPLPATSWRHETDGQSTVC